MIENNKSFKTENHSLFVNKKSLKIQNFTWAGIAQAL